MTLRIASAEIVSCCFLLVFLLSLLRNTDKSAISNRLFIAITASAGAGDDHIRKFAGILRQIFGDTGYVCRIGGESKRRFCRILQDITIFPCIRAAVMLYYSACDFRSHAFRCKEHFR